MTDEKWVALLSFAAAALLMVGSFQPLMQQQALIGDVLKLVSGLISLFVSYWFGVKPVRAARAARASAAK